MDDIISQGTAVTLAGLFAERVRRSPNAVAYREFDYPSGAWRDYTWRKMNDRISQIRAALGTTKLEPGDRIAIALPNCVDWVGFDVAALSLGLVVVPLYVHDSAANMSFILAHSGARLLVIDTEGRWSTLLPHWPELLALEHIWIRNGRRADASDHSRPGLRSLSDVLIPGTDALPVRPITPDMLATIIYTSGTTARPKGVMLTNRAVLWNVHAASRVVPPRPDDVFLSFLPLAHAFERTVGYYLPIIGGSTVAYARSIETLPQDLQTIRPTVFLGVPHVYERAYMSIKARAQRYRLLRAMLHLTANLGWKQFEARQGRRSWLKGAKRILWVYLDRWVGGTARAAFGGRLRVAVSGGAPLPIDVARYLIGLGLPLIEGYGLTEAAPVVATNTIDDNLPGSVGRALKGIDLKITSSGELAIRTPAAMTGYWKDDDLTAAAFDWSGWLRTGDIAEISDGRLFILGRTTERITLSTGEKVSPSEVEARIAHDPLFAQALVIGDGKPFLGAILVLEQTHWQQLAKQLALPADQPNSHIAHQEFLKRIKEKLEPLPRYSQVRAVHLTVEPWTVANGLLTPTLKVKRAPIEAKFAGEIARLYRRA